MDNIEFNPPWQLTGSGYIILCRFSKKEVIQKSLLPIKFNQLALGGLGIIMIVDYKKSNIGPYKELLIIPGKITYNNKKLKTISKIFVSTEESVLYGKKNWGIPKEMADFTFKKNKNHTQIKVSENNSSFFEISLTSYGPSFPITTSLMPLSLIQEYNQKIFYTNPVGKGAGRFALIKNIKIDNTRFPDISKKRQLIVLEIACFEMTFPKSHIENINNKLSRD